MVFGEIKPMPKDPLTFVYGLVKDVIKDTGYDFGEKGERYSSSALYCQKKRAF